LSVTKLNRHLGREGDIIPIYEYSCQDCGNRFELFVRKVGETAGVACTSCESDSVERMLSTPAVKSEATHGLAMRAAKKRDAAQGKARMHAQLKYEESHDRHGH
jgi:putative FmdB family regulatory protein